MSFCSPLVSLSGSVVLMLSLPFSDDHDARCSGETCRRAAGSSSESRSSAQPSLEPWEAVTCQQGRCRLQPPPPPPGKQTQPPRARPLSASAPRPIRRPPERDTRRSPRRTIKISAEVRRSPSPPHPPFIGSNQKLPSLPLTRIPQITTHNRRRPRDSRATRIRP